MTDEPMVDPGDGSEPREEPLGVAEPPEPTEPRAKLTLRRSGTLTDHVFEFAAPAIVGRFDPSVGPIDVDLGSLDEGVYVSRRHARIECNDGQWIVVDLGSSNGVFVLRDDFERVEAADLNDGDVVVFGNAQFVFSVLP